MAVAEYGSKNMAKQSIREVCMSVLQNANGPLTAQEIFAEINGKGLYTFKAKDPENILRSQLRKHSLNAKAKTSAAKCFQVSADGRFSLVNEKCDQ